MNTSSSFSVQLLSKIGAPLAQAVESVDLPAGQEDTVAAERMAAMLSMAVEMSIALYDKLDVTEDVTQADETRTALAAIAAELIAGFYTTSKKLPEATDKERLLKSLEAVLSFSDNFSSAGDASARLMTIGSKQPLFDKTQAKLVTLQSVTDVVNAISEFPFGQSENKLIQDVTESLEKDAVRLAKENGTNDKLSELMIFKSLAGIYAQCHRSETVKLSGGNQEAPPSLEPVWAAYEMRLAMMRAVMGGEEESVTAAPIAPEPESIQSTPADPSKEVLPTTIEGAAPVVAPVAAPVTAGPMGFFAGKKAESEASTSPETPPLTPPPVESASEPEGVETPAPTTPEAEKPAGEAGSPMSFFKAPPKKEDSE